MPIATAGCPTIKGPCAASTPFSGRGNRLTRRRVFGLLGAGSVGLLVASCGSTAAPRPAAPDFAARFAGFKPAPEPNGDRTKVVWPAFVTQAGPEVQSLYAFQVVNGDLMRYIPCFCGCHRVDGHRNNRDCYVEAVNLDGSVVFDAMAPT